MFRIAFIVAVLYGFAFIAKVAVTQLDKFFRKWKQNKNRKPK